MKKRHKGQHALCCALHCHGRLFPDWRAAGTIFTTLHFLCNLWIFPKSQCFLLQSLFKAQCNVALWLIEQTRKLRRKLSVANMVPGSFPSLGTSYHGNAVHNIKHADPEMFIFMHSECVVVWMSPKGLEVKFVINFNRRRQQNFIEMSHKKTDPLPPTKTKSPRSFFSTFFEWKTDKLWRRKPFKVFFDTLPHFCDGRKWSTPPPPSLPLLNLSKYWRKKDFF